MPMRCVLVSLPLQDPSMPSLGLALLCDALTAAGAECHVEDANLDFLSYVENAAGISPFLPTQAVDSTSYLALYHAQQRMFTDMGAAAPQYHFVPWQVCAMRGWPDIKQVREYALSPNNPWMVWLKHSDLVHRILETKPDWIGLSVTFEGQLPAAMALGKQLKECCDIPVVWGGALLRTFAAVLSPRTPIWDCADGVITSVGEGLVTTMRRHKHGRAGLYPACAVIHDKGWIASTVELQVARCPRFDALPLHKYRSAGLVLPYRVFGHCHWGRCTFCADKKYTGHTHRFNGDVEAIAAEIMCLGEQWRAQGIQFLDAELPASFMLELAQALCYRGSVLRWGANARLDARLAKADAATTLHLGGCRFLRFGLESGSNTILRAMNKGVTLAVADAVLKAVSTAGIGCHVYIMQGFPNETKAQLDATQIFLLGHQDEVDSYSLSDFILYEGAPLIDTLAQGHLLRDAAPDRWSYPRLVNTSNARLDAHETESHFYTNKATRCFPTLADSLLLGERFRLEYGLSKTSPADTSSKHRTFGRVSSGHAVQVL